MGVIDAPDRFGFLDRRRTAAAFRHGSDGLRDLRPASPWDDDMKDAGANR
jgi:hypothetical protein